LQAQRSADHVKPIAFALLLSLAGLAVGVPDAWSQAGDDMAAPVVAEVSSLRSEAARSGRRDPLDRSLILLDRWLEVAPADPRLQLELARTRLALARLGATPKAGTRGQRVGERFLESAAEAYLGAGAGSEAGRLARTELAALLLLPREYRNFQRFHAPILGSYRSDSIAQLAAAELMAWGRLEEAYGDLSASVSVYAAALDDSADCAMCRARLGRAQLASGDPAGAEAIRAALQSGDSAVRQLLLADVAPILEAAELDSFSTDLSADPVQAWTRFWQQRDWSAAREEGERIEAHYRRLHHARHEFRVEQWPRRYETFEVNRMPDSEIDDRGIIYLRHGPPDTTVTAISPGACYNETWAYRRAEGDLVLHFVARTDPSDWRLVETIYDVDGRGWLARTYDGCPRVEDLELSRISIAPVYGHLAFRRPNPKDLREERELVERSNRTALSTDDFRRRFPQAITPIVQLYGLFGERSPRVLTVVVIPGEEIEPVVRESSFEYSLDLELFLTDWSAGRRYASDTLRTIRAGERLEEGQYLVLAQEIAAVAGAYEAALAMENREGRAGQVATLPRLVIPDPDAPGPTLSDIVLGQESGSLTWQSPAGAFVLNPLNAYSRNRSAEIYYEVAGLRPGERYTTRIRLEPRKRNERAVEVGFEEVASGGILRLRRSIDLSETRNGDYDLVVEVSRAGDDRAARRSVTIHVVK